LFRIHSVDYFGLLIETIYKHGGDIIKFAGDAMLVVWPIDRPGLSEMVLLSCQCAKELLESMSSYEVEGTGCVLRLHIGVGAGEISGIHIGGTNHQLEFFISGQVLEQVSSCEKIASPGEVCVSEAAWTLVEKGRMNGSKKSKDPYPIYRLDSIEIPASLPEALEILVTTDMEAFLKAYIPPAVTRHVISGAKRWLAELRNVSVIFLNLTTPFKENKLPELQQAFIKMQTSIYKYEGTVRQFMIDDKGSVLIAGFGLPPFSHEDDATRAVECALDIYDTLQKLQIPCSIGVTSGKAFCGDVGSSKRREYAMVGDIVNLSARLMVAAKTNILCDMDTYEGSRHSPRIHYERLEEIRVKGKSNPIAVFQPSKVRRSGVLTRTLTSRMMLDIFGREEELQILKSCLNSIKQLNRPASDRLSVSPVTRLFIRTPVIIFEGSEGVGKTRLVRFVEHAMLESKLPVFVGYGDQLNNSTQFHAWQDIFQAALDDQGHLPPSTINELGKELVPLLNPILGLSLEETNSIKQMSGQQRSETTQVLLMKLLHILAQPGSLLILENAHWLDSASWGLALSACQQLDGVLIVIALRPIKNQSFQLSRIIHLPGSIYFCLKNLSQEDIAKMVAKRLNLKKVPETIMRTVYAKGQGNPFITEEIVEAILDLGTLQITKSGECVVTPEIEAAITRVPDSVAGLLTSKMDKLSPSQQIVLKVASVIGDLFPVRTVSVLLPNETDKSNIKQDLNSLERVGMIVKESPEPNLTYSFSNNLLKDVVYNLMLFSQKREIHKNIADHYQKESPGNTSFYPILAYHYKHAEEDQQALDFYLKSGSSSLYQFANKEAVNFFTEAVQLTEKMKMPITVESISMMRKLGQAYYNLGQLEKADEYLRKASGLMGIQVPAPGEKVKSIRNAGQLTFSVDKEKLKNSELSHRKREAVIVLLALAKVNLYACNKAIASFCAGLALQLSIGSVGPLLGESYALSALISAVSCDLKTAESYLAKGMEAAGKQLDVQKTVLQMQGMLFAGQAEWNKAIDSFTKAIEAAKTVGDLRTFEESVVFLATVFYLQGDMQQSFTKTKEALESAVLRGDIQTQLLSLNAQARNLFALGEFEKCFKCLEEINIAFESIGVTDLSVEANYYALWALMNLRMGELEDCWKAANLSLNVLSKIEPTIYFTFSSYAFLAETFVLLLQQPKLFNKEITKSKIAACCKKSLQLLEKFAESFVFATPRSMLWRAVMYHADGKSSKAEKIWPKCLESSVALGMHYEESLIAFEKGRCASSVSSESGKQDTDRANNIFPAIQSRLVNISPQLKQQTSLQTMKIFSNKSLPPSLPENPPLM